MYKLTCDGYPLLDWRDEDMILVDPKVKLEVNKVGEGSFTIYKDHPYYNKLKKLKSIFEVSDEIGVIFRGRMTGNTIEFDNEKTVDLEGVMAFFNDSIIRPFNFPEDFLEDEDYIAAAESGNVVAFFLNWLIEQHNSQVQDFQKLHLGNVTVSDPNNYISRSSEGYASTWETLKKKLFDSSLGGYLCARYEKDGTYIDYLESFELTNTQKIIYGENLLDLSNEMDANETYSAIIPQGKDKLTIKGLPDGNITEDIVKSGDTLHSRSAVESYGWIYAPIKDTTWEDVTLAENLQNKAVEWLVTQGIKHSSTIEVTAVDLHFTDEEVRSFRIYRNIQVISTAHGFEAIYPLTKLHIDLLNPQKTKITVGNTELTLIDKQDKDATQKIESATNDLKEVVSSTQKEVADLKTQVEGIEGTFFYIKYSAYSDGHIMTDVPQDDTLYMGTCSTNVKTAPTDYTKYTWCKVRGSDGETGAPGATGADGKTQYLHIKYSDDGKAFTGDIAPKDFGVWKNSENKGYEIISNLIAVTPDKAYKLQIPATDGYRVGLYLYDENRELIDSVTFAKQGKPLLVFLSANSYYAKIVVQSADTTSTFEDMTNAFNAGDIVPVMHLYGAIIGEELGAWIGTLVDFTEADSTTFSDYTWKKFTEDVDDELENIRQTIVKQSTSIMNDCESIIMTALESYVETSDYETFKSTVHSELSVLADSISMNFTSTTERINNVGGDAQAKLAEIYKHIGFGMDGITIGSSENAIKMNLDNDQLVLSKNGVEMVRIDIDNSTFTNIWIKSGGRLRLGNFAWDVQDNGVPVFMKVGE